MKKSDVLVHLAAISDQESQKKNSIKILSFNLEKSFKMILKAIDCKCKNFVIASTSSEYLNNGGKKPKEGEIVFIYGTKGDDVIFGEKLTILDEKIYTKLSEIN